MISNSHIKQFRRKILLPSPRHLVFTILSLAAIVGVFALSFFEMTLRDHATAFGVIVVAYLIMVLAWFVMSGRSRALSDPIGFETTQNDEIESGLTALEEANRFFAGSLSSADSFRLAANRINSMVGYDAILMILIGADGRSASIVQGDGKGAAELLGRRVELTLGAPSVAMSRNVISIENSDISEKAGFNITGREGFCSLAALPLVKKGVAYGALQLLSRSGNAYTPHHNDILEAIAERVSPFISSSLAFDRSRANALTDPVTEIPNERAFYVVLENQIAESSRRPEERPLSILAVDMKNFQEINFHFGHVNGDRVLNFVANRLRSELRSMDFIARANNDEFLILLPTADQTTASDIVNRIETAFIGRRFDFSPGESVAIDLNFGTATFLRDGDTVERMLASARHFKSRAKSPFPRRVVPFARDLVS